MLKKIFSLFKISLFNSWKHSQWWILGVLAVILSGFNNEINLLISNWQKINHFVTNLSLIKINQLINLSQINLSNFFHAKFIVYLFSIFSLLIILFLLWISFSARGGLIFSINQYAKTKFIPSFKKSFTVGRKFFWSILWISLLGKIIIYGGLLIISLPLIHLYLNSAHLFWGIILLIFLLILLIPIALIISFIVRFAICYLILQKKKVHQSWVLSWKLFHQHWLIITFTAILLFILGLLASLIIISFILIVNYPLTVLFKLSYGFSFVSPWLFLIIGTLVNIIFLLLFVGLFSAFQYNVWVNLFNQLIDNNFSQKKLIKSEQEVH